MSFDRPPSETGQFRGPKGSANGGYIANSWHLPQPSALVTAGATYALDLGLSFVLAIVACARAYRCDPNVAAVGPRLS